MNSNPKISQKNSSRSNKKQQIDYEKLKGKETMKPK
jgi:hypothetical protein